MSETWWQDAVGYQIYLRSFADGDGDGLGDLHGVRARLPYLAELGVDLVWVTPCYPTPDADHGYDVADYTDVDPRFGDLDVLQGVIDDAHELGLRLILDLVPNHTSDQHKWFRKAVEDPAAPEHDYYVWRPSRPDGGPPTNWRSHFGGPAWTFEPRVGKWYLHRFLPEQPDLNWRNPAVHERFEEILRFWFERGVDGFRIDVAHGLLVDAQFRDNPEPATPIDEDTDPRAAFAAIDHVHDLDQPEVVDIYREWRTVADEYGAFLVGEVYLDDPDEVGRYVAPDALHGAFCFPVLHTGWDAAAIRAAVTAGVAASGGRFAWPMSSHDDPRAATRFGGGRLGATRQLAYFHLLAALPGVPFLYQGDELGLDNGELPRTELEDPVSVRHGGAPGRDGSRTPMPWSPGENLGFTTGTPWLPLGTNRRAEDTVAYQRADDDSWLQRTRRFLQVRRSLRDLLGGEAVTWLDAPPQVVALARGELTVALNVGGPDATVELARPGTIAAASGDGAVIDGTALRLPADVSVWVMHR